MDYVWTIKLCPPKGENTFKFCFDKGIVGIGWGLNDGSDVQDSIQRYKELRKEQNLYLNDPNLDEALAMFEQFEKGDWIWTYTYSGSTKEYYLCEITDSQYRYLKDDEHEKAGIVQFIKKCEFHRIGFVDAVPKAIKTKLQYSNSAKASYVIGKVHDLRSLRKTERAIEIYIKK